MALIDSKMTQNAVGRTSAIETGNSIVATAQGETTKTPRNATERASKDGTKKRQYKARARHCKVCGTEFTPKIKTAVYCSGKCRSKALRQRRARGRAATPSTPTLDMITCVFCGGTNLLPAGKGARYCSARCRRHAYKVRRAAAVTTLAEIFKQDVEHVWDRVDTHGLKLAVETLQKAGYSYDDAARAWVKPPN